MIVCYNSTVNILKAKRNILTNIVNTKRNTTRGIQKLREDDIRSYLDTVERLYKVHQNEAQYINDLQWAFDNWSKMSDEQRKTISDKIMSAQSAVRKNIITDIKHQIKLLEK